MMTNSALSKWIVAATIAAGVAAVMAVAVVVLFVVADRRARGDRQALINAVGSAQSALTDEFRSNRSSTKKPSDQVHHVCRAYNANFSCTFTNLDGDAVSTCVRGKLRTNPDESISASRVERLGAEAGELQSLILCSGRVPPQTSVTVVVPWETDEAEDVCGTDSRWGRKLNWSRCAFTIEDAAAKAAAGRPKLGPDEEGPGSR